MRWIFFVLVLGAGSVLGFALLQLAAALVLQQPTVSSAF